MTLGWTDPIYCGSEKLCADTDHQYYLEYKLASAADDAYSNGAVVADSSPGPSHTTTYTLTGLDNGASYDFRLAVQLTGEADRGPWAELSAELEADSDGDGLQDSADAFPDDACASVDSDRDGSPDTIIAPGSTAPGGSAACSATTLVEDTDDDNDGVADLRDAFPLDGCAWVNTDGDGRTNGDMLPDFVIAPDDDPNDGCASASPLMADSDDDADGSSDADDVDDDNDGLIEIATRAELENLRYNLAGSSYDDEDDDGAGNEGAIIGAPTVATARCDTATSIEGSAIFLCGYELANDIDLQGTTSATSDDPPDISCASNAWTPIGGCGSDGKCAELSSNDDNPFTAIFEGNGFTISNLCIEGDGDSTDIDVLGLFGHLGGATVRNLTIAELYIEASFTGGSRSDDSDIGDNRIGGLAGYVTGATAILNVVATDSDAAVDLQGVTTDEGRSIGGLVGRLEGGSIASSFSTGAVAGGEGNNDLVGGLVGWQSGGGIASSFATGAVTGGDGTGDQVGGLVGFQSDGSITASFSTGAVDGGDGTGDQVGSLRGGPRIAYLGASYGFGELSGEESTGVEGNGSSKPSGVTEAAHLTGDSDDAMTYAGAAWSAEVWDFGDSSQAPALKYISSYARGDGPDNIAHTTDDRHSYSCDAADFPASLAVTCGTTLLPGQGR